MAINRFLSHTALATIAVTAALASCSSVEPSPGKTARVSMASPENGTPDPTVDAAQATNEVAAASGEVTTPDAALGKTGRIRIAVPDSPSVASVQTAAMASPEMAPQVAYAATDPVAATTAAAALQTVALPAGQAVGATTANLLAPPASAEPLATATPEVRTQTLAADEEELTPDMQALQAAIPIPRPDIAATAYAAQPSEPAAVATLQAVDIRTQFPPAPGEALPETASASPPEISALIKRYAGIYGVPESLIHRVVHRESRYNPKAYHKDGYWGLMQIKYATAKSMGYSGPPEGLLDAETNIKYATKYLRGAWLVADNSNDNAIRLYARGYYYDAKRKGMLHVLQQ